MNSADGINTRDGAQLLVQNNVFSNISKPLYDTDEGYAVAQGNDFGGESNTAPYVFNLTSSRILIDQTLFLGPGLSPLSHTHIPWTP